jgi:hypothetical protein
MHFVDWERSLQSSLFATCCASKTNHSGMGLCGLVPAQCIRILSVGSRVVDASILREFDSVFAAPRTFTAYPHFCPMPLTIEPGLDSFCWPYSKAQFIAEVYQRCAFAVHATGQRLEDFQHALLQGQVESPQERADRQQTSHQRSGRVKHPISSTKYVKTSLEEDVERMLQTATRITVWMKTTQGQMQYMDAAADIALNCFRSGHSLYFNPSQDVQTAFISQLASDLRHDFGLEKDGGIGGDLEIFAVQGKHATPWHFDAQENFTIQIRGTKRWTIAPSGVADPITNFHPQSTNRKSVLADYKVHAAYSDRNFGQRPFHLCSGNVIPTGEATPDERLHQQTLLLRPGSILYVPSGWWHKVDCDSDEGSLSINFSIDCGRWVDLLLSRLTPFIWSQPGWRSRISVPSLGHARETFGTLLSRLPDQIATLSASDFLPPGLQRGSGRVAEITIDPRCFDDDTWEGVSDDVEPNGGEFLKDWKITLDTSLRRNPLSILMSEQEEGLLCSRKQSSNHQTILENESNINQLRSFVSFQIHSGFGTPGFVSDWSTVIKVPQTSHLRGVLRWLMKLSQSSFELSTVADLASIYNSSSQSCSSSPLDFSFQRHESKVHDSALPEDLVQLVRVLCYCGFITNPSQ